MAIAGYNSSFLVTSQPSVALTTTACTNPSGDMKTWPISNALKRYLDKNFGSAPIVQTALDEIQSLTMSGNPTGGTFTLSFGGQTTGNIAWNASAATIQTALQALSSIGAGNVLCTGGPINTSPVQVEFTGTLGLANQAAITATSTGLTGGTSPTVNVAVVQNGQVFTTVSSSTYSIQWVGGVVIFNSPLLGTNANVHFLTGGGGYFPVATLGEAASCEFQGKVAMLAADVFGQGVGNGAKVFVPGLLEGTMKTNTWWLNHTRCQSLLNRDLIVVSFQTASGARYEGFCYAADCNIKADLKSLIGQDLTFNLTDQFFAN